MTSAVTSRTRSATTSTSGWPIRTGVSSTAFGYAVKKDTSTTPATETPKYLYVEFGREAIALPPVR